MYRITRDGQTIQVDSFTQAIAIAKLLGGANVNGWYVGKVIEGTQCAMLCRTGWARRITATSSIIRAITSVLLATR